MNKPAKLNYKHLLWTLPPALFALFYFFTPVSFLIGKDGFIAVTASIMVAISLTAAILSSEKVRMLVKNGEMPVRMYLIPVLLAIVFCMAFIFRFEKRITKDTVENGVLVNGVVLSGQREVKVTGISEQVDVTVKYTTLDGKPLVAKKTVISKQDPLFAGKEVEIYYSKQDPTVTVLVDDNIVRNYYKISNRDINIPDLIHMLNTRPDSVGIILNKISYKWVRDVNAERWYNERRLQAIEILPAQEIVFTRTNLWNEFYGFDFDLQNKLGFERLHSDSDNIVLYRNDKLDAKIEQIDNGVIAISIRER